LRAMSFFKEETRIGLKKLQIVYYVQRCENTSLLDEKIVVCSTVCGKNARRLWLCREIELATVM